MTSVMSLYLRRTEISSGFIQYLLLPIDSLEMVPEDMPVAPVIPGSDYTNIFGEGSPNFLLDLGSKALSIRASGNLINVTEENYPGNLSGNNYYIVGRDDVDGTSGASLITTTQLASGAAQNAEQLRVAIYDFWLSQSNTSAYTDFYFGYPNFVRSSALTDVTGISTTLFRGMLRAPRISEAEGVSQQFPLTLMWRVGAS